MNIGGFHSHKVVTGTQGDINGNGSYLYAEVTSDSDLNTFYPNAFNYNADGTLGSPRASSGIPLKPGVTLTLPMALYNFRADLAVTVVAYGK